MDKNATIDFSFYPDDYSDVCLSFHCDEDLTFDELIEYFCSFAIAMGYSPNTIKRYVKEV